MNSKDLLKLNQELIESKDYKKFVKQISKSNEPNIFRILEITKKEDLTHSNFLAWMFNQSENHSIKESFLSSFLSNVTGENIDTYTNKNVNVFREYVGRDGRIDILIEFDELVVCIENKIESPESDNQLEIYKTILETNFPKKEHLYIFLTPDGRQSEKLRDLYIPVSYENVSQILE